jgi:hypothetical protein
VNSVCSHTVTLKLDSVASLWVLFGSVDDGRDEGRVVTKMVETARSVVRVTKRFKVCFGWASRRCSYGL